MLVRSFVLGGAAFEVSTDALVAIILGVIAFASCILPAVAASRIDPREVLPSS